MKPSATRAKIRVFLADDQLMVRRGLQLLLSMEPDLMVCGESPVQPGSWRMLEVLQPDLLIMDVACKAGDGVEFIRRLRRTHPLMRILVFSMHESVAFAERALAAGAHGYVAKRDGTEELVQAIHSLLEDTPRLGVNMAARTGRHSRIRLPLSSPSPNTLGPIPS